MSPATRRDARTDSAQASKRQRTLTTAAPPTSNDMNVDLFDTGPTRSPIDVQAKVEYDFIDLTETNEVVEEARKPQKDERIKLAAFQCTICMDDCFNLTVTKCGHLYCASCLYRSIHANTNKGKCPMCRQKLGEKPRESDGRNSKGYWPLELKLTTATRKGKRKASTLS